MVFTIIFLAFTALVLFWFKSGLYWRQVRFFLKRYGVNISDMYNYEVEMKVRIAVKADNENLAAKNAVAKTGLPQECIGKLSVKRISEKPDEGQMELPFD